MLNLQKYNISLFQKRKKVPNKVDFNNAFKTNAAISFVSSFRCKGNEKEHNPKVFFESLIKNTSILDNIEVLIAVDSDDDLDYFKRIEIKYQPKIKNLKFFISPERYGYEGLHLYDKFLYQFLSTSSKMVCDFSDDCQIVLKDFDNHLMQIDKSIKDGIYFINTGNLNLERYVGDCERNIAKTIWKCQAIGPSCYFPIVSKKVIGIATESLNLLSEEKKREWAPLTNSFCFDVYVDVIANYMPFKSKNRFLNLHMMDIMRQFNSEKRHLKVNFDKNIKLTWGKHGLTPNDLSFLKLLELETLQHLEKVAQKLYNIIEDDTR